MFFRGINKLENHEESSNNSIIAFKKGNNKSSNLMANEKVMAKFA